MIKVRRIYEIEERVMRVVPMWADDVITHYSLRVGTSEVSLSEDGVFEVIELLNEAVLTEKKHAK